MNGEGEIFHDVASMEPEPAEIVRKPLRSSNVVSVQVDRGASGHYLGDIIIPDLKHRLHEDSCLSTPGTIQLEELCLTTQRRMYYHECS